MPFIVTTKRPQRVIADDLASAYEDRVVARRAVATLEEARTEVTRLALVDGEALLADNYGDLREQFSGVREQGGSVGPLPDGTVIEVTPASYVALAEACGHARTRSLSITDAEIIAAYNAKQEGS